MTDRILDVDEARTIAYLQNHPDFFEKFPQALEGLRFPHPTSQGDSVSFAGYQLTGLRSELEQLRSQMDTLIANARTNDALNERLAAWGASLLREPASAQLPTLLTSGIRQYFAVPYVALRLWAVAPRFAVLDCAQALSDEDSAFAKSLDAPAVGTDPLPVLGWLGGDAGHVRSSAALPLAASHRTIGLLLLASPDPDRFDHSADTAFLSRLSTIASAAMTRLTYV